MELKKNKRGIEQLLAMMIILILGVVLLIVISMGGIKPIYAFILSIGASIKWTRRVVTRLQQIWSYQGV
jgi:hypothetical protein